MKLTVITDEQGAIVGAMQGHAPRPDIGKPRTDATEFRAGLVAGPGQRMHEIEVPDSLAKIKDPDEFGRSLSQHVFAEGLLAK